MRREFVKPYRSAATRGGNQSRTGTPARPAELSDRDGQECPSYRIHARDPEFRRRAGTSLVEVIVAAMLLGTVMAIAIPSLGLVGHQRRAAERRQQAMLEVENLMERFTASGWENVTAENAAQLKLSADVERQLPGAALKCSVTAQASPLEAKRVQIELTWSNRAGEPVAPVRLTTWVYRTGRSQ